jgi:hypothetical protein
VMRARLCALAKSGSGAPKLILSFRISRGRGPSQTTTMPSSLYCGNGLGDGAVAAECFIEARRAGALFRVVGCMSADSGSNVRGFAAVLGCLVWTCPCDPASMRSCSTAYPSPLQGAFSSVHFLPNLELLQRKILLLKDKTRYDKLPLRACTSARCGVVWDVIERSCFG